MTSVERQVRVLMRAWPIPDRVERGNEIVGTSLDLVPDGRRLLPLALATNLVIGGVRARWRMRPPPWRWIWYRFGGLLPVRWHRWMLNDLGRGYRRRYATFMAALMLLTVAISNAVIQFDHPSPGDLGLFWLGPAIGAASGAVTGSRRKARKERVKQLARYGYLQAAESPPPEPSSSR